jgi:hypothetical protein
MLYYVKTFFIGMKGGAGSQLISKSYELRNKKKAERRARSISHRGGDPQPFFLLLTFSFLLLTF